jgi:chitinase
MVWSFGGWTWSGGFGQAAANATAFANQCYGLVNGDGQPANWAGVMDGIDIDWEYPNACGLSCDSSGTAAFGNLMSALRTRFGTKLVTAAITADGTSGGKIDLGGYGGAASNAVNWYDLMTYDYFGGWATTGPTAPHSPLDEYPGIPIAGGFNSAAAVAKLKSKGVPGSKILLGIGAYGRGWKGVTQSAPGGSATGMGNCTYPTQCEPGIEDYWVLSKSGSPAGRCEPTGVVGGTAYAFCAPEWWGYDTPATVIGKMNWMTGQGLGGSFMWESSGDRQNRLVRELR